MEKLSLSQLLFECLDNIQGFLDFGKHGDVSHLPPGTGLGLAIDVKLGSWLAEHHTPIRSAVFPEISQQIPHHDRGKQCVRPQGEAANRPQLLLELTRYARVEGVMARIVRTGRQFIDQEATVAREEKFRTPTG